MCSIDCPCKDVPNKTDWTTLTKVDNRDLPCKVWDFTGVKGAKTVNYTTYKQCIEYTKETASLSETFAIFAKKFREQSDYETIMKWIEFFEDEYTCAGICSPALFYWSKSIEIGKPTKPCIMRIKDDLSASFTGLAIATLISGFLLFVIWIM